MSKWASRNPIKSRFLITICHLLAVANSIVLGLLLFLSDWPDSSLLVFLLVNIFFVVYLRYPDKSRRLSKKVYWHQKRSDFILALCYSFLIAVSVNAYLVNEEGISGSQAGLAEATIMHSALSTPPPAAIAADAPPTRAERRGARRSQFKALKAQFKELKAELRAWKKDHKGQKKGSGAVKALLLLLVILGAVALAYVVAVLSCSLSCNGQEGAAIVLLLGGLTGVIWLSIFLIREISRGYDASSSQPGQAK
jgi:hypothetical protein